MVQCSFFFFRVVKKTDRNGVFVAIPLQIWLLRHGWDIKDCVITAMLWTSGGDLFGSKMKKL
jgi:hypothetical protein